jgi:hypothetical protein
VLSPPSEDQEPQLKSPRHILQLLHKVSSSSPARRKGRRRGAGEDWEVRAEKKRLITKRVDRLPKRGSEERVLKVEQELRLPRLARVSYVLGKSEGLEQMPRLMESQPITGWER